jgi:hypothetical protein
MAKVPLAPVEDLGEREAIATAISGLDPTSSTNWKAFVDAVPGARVDAIEPQSIFKAGDMFEASATVYVIIPGSPTSVESFPANVMGQLKRGREVEIKSFDVRTSSFFGESQFPWRSKIS